MNLSPEQEQFIARVGEIEKVIGTPFWPILKEFCQEVARESLNQSQLQPQNSQWYAGAAKVALDIYERLNEFPVQKQQLLREIATSAEAEETPKTSPGRPPLSHL